MHSTLIEPEELQQHLNKDDWAVIDCRFYLPEPDRGEAEYLASHIPGAVYAHLDRDLSGPLTGRNGRHPLPSVEQMVDRFSSWGIDREVQVVGYDGAGGQFAARLWWMLRYLGHDQVAVLNGGFSRWREEDLPIRGGREERSPHRFIPEVREEMRVDVQALEKPGGLDRFLLIDARAPERFRGETEPLDPVAGRIPGARNHPSGANLDDAGRFLPRETLEKHFRALVGERPRDEVVSYCGSGVTACHNLLALEIAGVSGARLYPGSWSEWCADDSRPVETGPDSS